MKNSDAATPVQPDLELALRDKSLFIGNSAGQVKAYTVEEVLSNKLNVWNGWYCAIGVENLHVSADGNVSGGACRNSGFFGNAYHFIENIPTEWYQCRKPTCFCGGDMQVRKAKSLSLKEMTYRDPDADSIVDDLKDPAFVAPVHQSIHKQYPLSISWDLGRRCNYSCSYCPPIVSNKFEAFKTWGSLMYAYEEISRTFLKNRKSKFTFTGGEPTLNPKYMDFVNFLKDEGHIIHTTTNGSRSAEYFSELIEKSFIGLSYHLEFAIKDHFEGVLRAIIQKKNIHQEAKNNWCGVRIMVPPNRFAEAKDLYDSFKGIDGFRDHEIMLSMSPLFEADKTQELIKYSEEELRDIGRLG